MAKDSFIFYRSFYEAIKDIPKKHRSVIYEAVFEYVFESKEPTLCGVPSALWKLIKPQLDANQLRYENGKKGAEYGKLGGRPRKIDNDKNPIGVIKKTPEGLSSKTPNVNVNVNENVNDNANVNVNVPDGENETNTNKRPTKNDILNYCQERGYEIDADRFLEYNEAKGWVMDWPAAVEKWVGVERYKAKQAKKNRFNDFSNQRENNYSELQLELLRKQNMNLLEGKEAAD